VTEFLPPQKNPVLLARRCSIAALTINWGELLQRLLLRVRKVNEISGSPHHRVRCLSCFNPVRRDYLHRDEYFDILGVHFRVARICEHRLTLQPALRDRSSSIGERLYGTKAGVVATALIMWTAFASVFSLLLGYSRVPFAAARDGNYFHVFAKVHARHRFPYVSLLVMGGIATLFCFFRLADVIAGAGGDSYPRAVPCADRWRDCLARASS
jgi:hypothetical protein